MTLRHDSHKDFSVLCRAAVIWLSISMTGWTQSSVAAVAAPSPAGAYMIQDSPRPVLFFGDDATQQRMFTTLIETYTLTRFPHWKIIFRNTGWAGDKMRFAGVRARSGDQAIRRDIESYRPQIVLVNYGLNDAMGGDAAYDQFLVGVNVLSRDLPRIGVYRAVFISSNPAEGYEKDQPAGASLNGTLKKFADGMRDRFPIGWQDGVDFMQKHPKGPERPDIRNGVFIDLFDPMLGLIEAGRKSGILSRDNSLGTKTARLIPDGIHPNWSGHLIMAAIILQGMHAPALVSAATLDAANRATMSALGCTIEWQPGMGGTVQFKRTDSALPWPIPPACDLALQIPGFDPAASLNQYDLRVTGLAANSYLLSIDGSVIGTYSKDSLAGGVNLGFVRRGPIYNQGQKLLQAVLDKNETFYNRWHNVQIGQQPDPKTAPAASIEAYKAELSRLDQLIEKQEQSINELRVPVPHVFKLQPVSQK